MFNLRVYGSKVASLMDRNSVKSKIILEAHQNLFTCLSVSFHGLREKTQNHINQVLLTSLSITQLIERSYCAHSTCQTKERTGSVLLEVLVYSLMALNEQFYFAKVKYTKNLANLKPYLNFKFKNLITHNLSYFSNIF